MAIIEDKIASAHGTDPSSEGVPGDIELALQKTGHYTCSYPNGFTVGVRLEAIPNTRGVHVDVVMVLDMRVARFGKSGLAMRAAVLETVNRPLTKILDDVGLSGRLQERSFFTARGRVRLPVLISPDGKRSSFVHETRNVYVVTGSVRPSIDLSWLTDSKRIVPASEFTLVRNSDARALLPSLNKVVDREKWVALERAVKFGWWSMAAVASTLLGGLSFVNALGAGQMAPLPLLMMVVSLFSLLYLYRACDVHLQRFNSSCIIEKERLDVLGDKNRIEQAIHENRSMLSLVGDLNFIVSPLMASAAESLRDDDLSGAITSACAVLDECVRHSTSKGDATGLFGSKDEGLNKFLGLFESLGASTEKERLALAYVALSGYPDTPIPESELAEHIGVLNNTLFDAGILRPHVKDAVDDILNQWAMEITVKDLSKELGKDEPAGELPKSESEDAAAPEESAALEIITKAGTEPVAKTMGDDMPTITAEDA